MRRLAVAVGLGTCLLATAAACGGAGGSGTAATETRPVAGLRFDPPRFPALRGWHGGSGSVGTPSVDESGRVAFTATVRWRDAPLELPPHRTLAHFPRDAIAISVSLLRDAPWPPSVAAARRSAFPPRDEIRLAEATVEDWPGQTSRRIPLYRILGTLPGRYAFDAWVFFGRRHPTRGQFAAAQQRLRTLVLPRWPVVPPGYRIWRDSQAGAEAQLPPAWSATVQPADSALAGNQVLLAASTDLRGLSTSRSCSPTEVRRRVGARGAFVLVFEYPHRAPDADLGGGPRPAHFVTPGHPVRPYECFGPSREYAFRDGGRDLQAHIALGTRASKATEFAALRVLDSLRLAPCTRRRATVHPCAWKRR